MPLRKDTPEKEVLELGEGCKRCGRCCEKGSGFLAEGDAERIADKLGLTTEELLSGYLKKIRIYGKEVLKPALLGNPFGPCIFLKEGKCSIHDVKPLMCRIATCREEGKEIAEWFLLNHVIDPSSRESMREWATRLKTHKTIPGGEIENLIPDRRIREEILR